MPVTIRDKANEKKIKQIAKARGDVSKHAAVVMAIHDLYERVVLKTTEQTPPETTGVTNR